MARFDNTVISITLTAKEARQELQKLQANIDALKDSIVDAQARMNDPNKWKPGEKPEDISKDIQKMEKELKAMEKSYKRREQMFQGINDVLQNISGASYNEAIRVQNILLARLKNIKTDTLEGIKDYEKISKELQKARDAVAKKAIDVKGSMTEQKASDVMANLKDYSATEIEDAIKVMERLRDMQQIGGDEWKKYAAQIAEANKELDKFRGQNKIDAMAGQLSNIGSLSKSALAEQKKFWQAAVDGAAQGSSELTQYEANLKKVNEQQKALVSQEGKGLVDSVLTDSWSGTISEAKETVKTLKEYKDTLDTTDTDNIQAVDRAMAELTNKTKLAEAGFNSTKEALSFLSEKAKDLGEGKFTGSLSELEEMQKKLIVIRDTQEDVLSPDERNTLQQSLQRVNKELAIMKGDVVDVNYIMSKPLKSFPMETLEKAARQLKDELKQCTINTDKFTRKSADLRKVNKQLEKIKENFKEQENIILKTSKRLAAYVAVYGGFNFIWGKIKSVASANLSLSDSMADVQKTTGMTSAEISELGKAIDMIDTRTAQSELYNLAATAGQLGIRGKENILGFVNASNQITVALNELGAEGTATLMKIADLTGDIAEHGTEQALLRIGSAINELTATTTATAGPITDFISRFGGVASAAEITTHEMAAVGATADALKQEIEVTGTAMNKVVNAVTNNTRNLASAVNVDYKALRQLVNEGKTMDAIVVVFEAMKNTGNVTAEALKELGSEGDRMNRVITSFVGNIDMLKNNLSTSAAAFEEMTSIQNEYNVKNENAAALWERIQNTLLEIVSNPKFVGWLTDMLHSLKGLTDWLTQSEGAARLLISAMLTFMGVKVVAFISSINKALLELKIMLAATSEGFIAFGTKFKALGRLLKNTAGGFDTVKKAAGGLFKILRAHPLLLIASGVGILVTQLVKFKSAAEKAAEAQAALGEEQAKLLSQYEDERRGAEQLAQQIKSMNADNEERKSLISQFNNTYGKYLGYMLQEKATAQEVAAAYALVNAAMTKKHQLDVVNISKNKENIQYESDRVTYIQRLRQELSNLGVKDADISKATALVNTLAMQGKTAEEILAAVNKQLGTEFQMMEDYTRRSTYGAQYSAKKDTELNKILTAYSDRGKAYADEMKRLADEARIIEEASSEEVFLMKQKYLNEELANLKAMTAANDSEIKERRQAYQEYFNTLSGYYKQATKEQKNELDKNLSNLKNSMKGVKGVADLIDTFTFDPWGKGDNLDNWTTFAETMKNLDKASPKSLAATLKAIEEQSQDMSEQGLKNFNSMFQTNFDTTNLEKFNNQVYSLGKKLRARLKELNRGTDANFLWGGGDSNKKTAQQMYKEWLAELEAYYNERETLIRQRGQEQNKLESEINRELEALNAERLRAQRELEEGLLKDQASKSTFDPKSYVGPITNTKYFADMTLEQMRAIVSAGGTKLDAEIRKNLTDRMVKLEEQAYKIKQRIEKILLEDDFSAQVAEEYLKALDELGLLFNIETEAQTEMSREAGEARLAYMREWAKESYNLTAETLENEMRQNELFNAWVEGRELEHYEALLVQLRKFHDDQIEADKKAADRRKKIFDASKKGQDLREQGKTSESAAQTRVDQEEKDVKMWERFKDLDLVSEDMIDKKQIEVGEAQIKLYNAKIAASQAYIAQMQLEMEVERQKADATIASIKEQLANTSLSNEQRNELNAQLVAAEQHKQSLLRQEEMMTEQERNNILKAETERTKTYQEIADRYVSIEQRKVGEVKKYTDALVSFSGQMGEAAWGEVEDRQEAGKQLIKSLLTTLKDWVTVKLKELAMQQMFANQSNAISGGEMIKNLTAEGAEATGSVAVAGVKGTADSVSKMGLGGLLVGAAISAALSALLGVAMGKLNKKKAEIASITKASNGGRLATGMLTYAEGNYPVLGNDGKVYDAKYEGAGMKTGIYRGGAHFGIFSEKKPEAIIDGDTTQRLILNHPDIWKAIVTLSKTGRLDRGMATFATGNIEQLTKQATQTASSVTALPSPEVAQMQAALENNNRVIAQLSAILANGIQAKMDMYGPKGAYNNMKKAEKFAVRRGI